MKIHCLLTVAAVSLVGLTSCDGIFEGIYDQAVDDAEFEQGLRPVSASSNRYSLMVDARDYESWYYVSFKDRTITQADVPSSLTGEWDGRSGWTYNHVEGDKYTQVSFTMTDTQPQPQEWDFAIHHFDIKTNDGAGMMTQYTSVDQFLAAAPALTDDMFTPDVWNTTQVITDLAGMMAFNIGYQNSYVNEVLSTMVTMDFSTPPPTYHPTGRVYVMRLADGSKAVMQLTNYMSQAGTKGFLTFDIIYPYR